MWGTYVAIEKGVWTNCLYLVPPPVALLSYPYMERHGGHCYAVGYLHPSSFMWWWGSPRHACCSWSAGVKGCVVKMA